MIARPDKRNGASRSPAYAAALQRQMSDSVAWRALVERKTVAMLESKARIRQERRAKYGSPPEGTAGEAG